MIRDKKEENTTVGNHTDRPHQNHRDRQQLHAGCDGFMLQNVSDSF